MRLGRGIGGLLLGMFALGAMVPAARAERALTSPEFSPNSGIEMKLTSAYEDIPPFGYLPVRVAIKNRTNAPHTWTFDSSCIQASSHTTSFHTSLTVEPETEKIFDLLVPLTPPMDSYRRYSNLSITLEGYGITGERNASLSSGGRGGSATPFAGMSEGLSVKNWGPLRDDLDKKHKKSLEGTALDVDLLPADWRGLAAFSIVFFTDDEWRRLAAGQRGAILDWVAQGGDLILCGTGAVADLPATGQVGSGTIEIWPMGDDFVAHASKVLDGDDKAPIAKSIGAYSQNWEMAEAVGQSEPPQALILGFVIIFGTIVGPVNFLVLAPAGRRSRLFWTTPLISLGASLLLGSFILLSEGFGGKGLRMQALLSLPADHKEVLWQEQVSRTGILTSNAFTPSEPNLLLPLSLRAIRPRAESNRNYQLNGAIWSGDWFRNRATQGQLLTSVAPTRGKLDITTDASGTPAATSSFEQPLEKCWYVDNDGKAWKAEDLGPGERKTMKSVTPTEYESGWNAALHDAGPVITTAAQSFAQGIPKGKFFATTKALPQPISTLPVIRWQAAGALIYGLPAR